MAHIYHLLEVGVIWSSGMTQKGNIPLQMGHPKKKSVPSSIGVEGVQTIPPQNRYDIGHDGERMRFRKQYPIDFAEL